MFIGKVYEKLIAEMFGDGRKVDVSDITVSLISLPRLEETRSNGGV